MQADPQGGNKSNNSDASSDGDDDNDETYTMLPDSAFSGNRGVLKTPEGLSISIVKGSITAQKVFKKT